MATRGIVPRANAEGKLGSSTKRWQDIFGVNGNFSVLTAGSLTITSMNFVDSTVSGTLTAANIAATNASIAALTITGSLTLPAGATVTAQTLTATGQVNAATVVATTSVGAPSADFGATETNTLSVLTSASIAGLTVTGATALSSLTVSGATTLASLTVTGSASIPNLAFTDLSAVTLALTGAATLVSATVSNTLTVTGLTTLVALNATSVLAGTVEASTSVTAPTINSTGTVSTVNLTVTNNTALASLNVSGSAALNAVGMNWAELTKPKLVNYTEKVQTVTGTGTAAFDMAAGNVGVMSMTGNVTLFQMANVAAAGSAHSFTLVVHQDSTLRTFAWPSNFKWTNGSPEMLVASKTYIFTGFTVDGGTNWYCSVVGKEL